MVSDFAIPLDMFTTEASQQPLHHQQYSNLADLLEVSLALRFTESAMVHGSCSGVLRLTPGNNDPVDQMLGRWMPSSTSIYVSNRVPLSTHDHEFFYSPTITVQYRITPGDQHTFMNSRMLPLAVISMACTIVRSTPPSSASFFGSISVPIQPKIWLTYLDGRRTSCERSRYCQCNGDGGLDNSGVDMALSTYC
ncbi:hypothetical protein JAAARDRAFT_638261 [Jaapia argillacea MUCL 33604]|uniref:Uncharacterized protein n=1 Tax=Jaapia argillacea MUCL 33604 TaxID=933084 RepID=A0A067PGI8_9AGAM|nr:hypothetical protein JAAARDRAFT_638261 [Jaapia argillacea MUCL 33604]